MRSYGLKTKTIFRRFNRFFHYEPLSTSSFRKNLSIPGAIYFQKAKFLRNIKNTKKTIFFYFVLSNFRVFVIVFKFRSHPLYPVALFLFLNDFSNDKGIFFHRNKPIQNFLGAFLANNGNHADAVVKRPHHLFFRYIAGPLKIRKHGGHIPTVSSQQNAASIRNDANNIARNTAAGDVGKSENRQILDNAVNGFRIYPRWGDEFFADGSAEFRYICVDF